MKKYLLKPATKEQKEICRKFALDCVDTNKGEYARRNQNNRDKIIKDIEYGKLAEFMVYNFYTEVGLELEEPDVKIYGKKKKSFDADLKIRNSNLHVKSCLNNSNYPNSWMFQKNDPLVISPNNNDFIAFCVLTPMGGYFYLVNGDQVPYGVPVLERLRDTKVCVYEETLFNAEIKLNKYVN